MDKQQQLDATIMLRKAGMSNMNTTSLQILNTHFTNCNEKVIFVMSHTCNQDFLLGLLLFLGCSNIPITMFTRFKNPLLIALCKQLGMITFSKDKSNTDAIISHLAKKEKFALLIALGRAEKLTTSVVTDNPEVQNQVKSGYFYISQALQAPIIVLGFDYYMKSGYVSSSRWLPLATQTYEEFKLVEEKQILTEIQNIWPLKPDYQVGFVRQLYPIRNEWALSQVKALSMTKLYTQVAQVCFPKQTLLLLSSIGFAFLILIVVVAIVREVIIYKKWKRFKSLLNSRNIGQSIQK